MLPVDVLVLDLQHLAAAAPRVERADDPIAHLVAGRELRVRIPNLAGHDFAAERLRDLERSRPFPAEGCPPAPRRRFLTTSHVSFALPRGTR